MNDVLIFLIELAIGLIAQWALGVGWRTGKRIWAKYGVTIVPAAKAKRYADLEIELVRRDLHIDELKNVLAAAIANNPSLRLNSSEVNDETQQERHSDD